MLQVAPVRAQEARARLPKEPQRQAVVAEAEAGVSWAALRLRRTFTSLPARTALNRLVNAEPVIVLYSSIFVHWSLQILLVEDVRSTRKLLGMQLKRHHVNTVDAEDGLKASVLSTRQ